MKKILTFALLLTPTLASAQTLSNINDVARKAVNIGNLFVQLAIGLAVIWIIINVFKYFIAGGEDDRHAGAMSVLYGVIGLFVIISIWGFVYLLTGTFKFSSNTRPSFDSVKIPDPTGKSSPSGNSIDGTTLVPGVNGDYNQ